MYRNRVIPCLLIRGNGLVKTRKFKDAVYIGDPVNAARIFSEKEADEIVVLDIDASREGREPNYELVAEIAGECFMPMAYGGGVRSLEQVRKLIRSGVEKVVINSAAVDSVGIITEASDVFGSQAIVAAVDVKRTLLGGFRVLAKSASVETRLKLEVHVRQLVAAGAGEIFLNSIDRDGMMQGYDVDFAKSVRAAIDIPMTVLGGAGNLDHMRELTDALGTIGAAAGSMFVFKGPYRAVLISYDRP